MKRLRIASAVAAVVLFVAAAACAQGGGFTGPGSSKNKGQAVKVSAVKSLPVDSRVVLTGKILRAVGGEKYIFSDGTGEITIDVDDKVWKGLSVSEKDAVEIFGKIEKKKKSGELEIDVKSITKS